MAIVNEYVVVFLIRQGPLGKPPGRGGSKIPRKWLREGAKGLLDPGSENPLALVAPVQQQVSEGARDPWETLLLPGSKRPFAPSRTHFREFSTFDPLSQAAWFARLTSILCRFFLPCFGPVARNRFFFPNRKTRNLTGVVHAPKFKQQGSPQD